MSLFSTFSETTEASEKATTFTELQQACSSCTACGLRSQEQVQQVVFGTGNANADLMFVGEAPGFNEDIDGVPFTGRSGRLLREVIDAMGFKINEVYLANVLKCRPPQNRDPETQEIEMCTPWLNRQIDMIKPKVIVTLGKFASHHILSQQGICKARLNQFSITAVRGELIEAGDVKIMPTWHPAFLLRNEDAKPEFWDDMKIVCKELNVTPENER